MDERIEEGVEDWPKFSDIEQECISHIESLPDETLFENEKLNYERRLWTLFQNSALAIAQLYSRDNIQAPHSLWNSFQQASTNVASLYKECTEFQKRLHENNSQCTYNKRTKEVLSWAKKKKNIIRRDELLAFLSGRTNYLHNNCFYHRYPRNARQNRDEFRFINLNSSSPKKLNDPACESDVLLDETNLEVFKEALSLSNLRNSTSLLNNSSIKRSPRSSDELREFISQEYHRHVESRKRTSSMDVCMDSPASNKRAKFF